MQCVTAVDPQWLAEYGGIFFSIRDPNVSISSKKREERDEEKKKWKKNLKKNLKEID